MLSLFARTAFAFCQLSQSPAVSLQWVKPIIRNIKKIQSKVRVKVNVSFLSSIIALTIR